MTETPTALDKPETAAGGEVLTVIVPCFNEEQAVRTTVEDILATAPRLGIPLRVLLIDDGSTDATRREMTALCERHACCSMMVNERNKGVGRCVLNAYERLDADSWATVMPGDNELVFASIANLLARRADHDIVLGYLQNPVIRPLGRRLASSAFTRVVNFLYGFSFRYLNGMKLYRVGCFKGIEVLSGGHAFNAELIAKAILRLPEIRIGEAPFVARGRSRGSSKAIRPASVVRAVLEVFAGWRRVGRYRDQILRERG